MGRDYATTATIIFPHLLLSLQKQQYRINYHSFEKISENIMWNLLLHSLLSSQK